MAILSPEQIEEWNTVLSDATSERTRLQSRQTALSTRKSSSSDSFDSQIASLETQIDDLTATLSDLYVNYDGLTGLTPPLEFEDL